MQSAQALVSQAQQTSDTTVRAGLATQFDAIQTQIDQLAGDSGFNGINLLDSTNSTNLTVTLNESGTSSVTINAVDFTSAGLGDQQRRPTTGAAPPTSPRPAPT